MRNQINSTLLAIDSCEAIIPAKSGPLNVKSTGHTYILNVFQGKFEEKSLCKVKHVKVIGLDLTQVIKRENRADEEDIEGLRRY